MKHRVARCPCPPRANVSCDAGALLHYLLRSGALLSIELLLSPGRLSSARAFCDGFALKALSVSLLSWDAHVVLQTTRGPWVSHRVCHSHNGALPALISNFAHGRRPSHHGAPEPLEHKFAHLGTNFLSFGTVHLDDSVISSHTVLSLEAFLIPASFLSRGLPLRPRPCISATFGRDAHRFS